MKITETWLSGLYIIEPSIFRDDRGYFFETFNFRELSKMGISLQFVQDNQSKSMYGVIRGFHYQLAPFAQTKLIRVLEGKIYDVALDIRRKSSTFGKWFGIELSAENNIQLLIPKGFAHGFSVTGETAVVFYKCDDFYNPASERGIKYDDPHLNIDWHISPENIIVSPKDAGLPLFRNAEMNF